MPYKDKEKRKLVSAEKVEIVCCVCGGIGIIRRDTAYKYKNNTCSDKCKREHQSRIISNKINEDDFVNEYKTLNCGYQALAAKYKIGGIKAIEVLSRNGIGVSGDAAVSNMRENNIGKWVKSERRTCKNKKCQKDFKYRKSSTLGLYCSHYCYMSCGKRSTSIEVKIENLLIEIGVEYKTQFKIGRYYFDFIIPSAKILIECDGNYWHGNPKLFPTPTELQKKHIERDKRKTLLAEVDGYNLIRLWETEINNNIKSIKEIIQNEILSDS